MVARARHRGRCACSMGKCDLLRAPWSVSRLGLGVRPASRASAWPEKGPLSNCKDDDLPVQVTCVSQLARRSTFQPRARPDLTRKRGSPAGRTAMTCCVHMMMPRCTAPRTSSTASCWASHQNERLAVRAAPSRSCALIVSLSVSTGSPGRSSRRIAVSSAASGAGRWPGKQSEAHRLRLQPPPERPITSSDELRSGLKEV